MTAAPTGTSIRNDFLHANSSTAMPVLHEDQDPREGGRGGEVRGSGDRANTAYSDRLALVSRWARDHLDLSSVPRSVSVSAPNTARPPSTNAGGGGSQVKTQRIKSNNSAVKTQRIKSNPAPPQSAPDEPAAAPAPNKNEVHKRPHQVAGKRAFD